MESMSKTPLRVKRARAVLREVDKQKATEARTKVRAEVKRVKSNKAKVLKDLSVLNKAHFKEQSDLSKELSKVSAKRMELEAQETEIKQLLEDLAAKQKEDPKKVKLIARITYFNQKLSDLGVVPDSGNSSSEPQGKE